MLKMAIRLLLPVVITGLLLPGLTGCGSDEEDIVAPSLTLDSLQEQNVNKTGTPAFKVDGDASLSLSGTVETGALVEVEVNSDEPVVVNVVGDSWDYTLSNASLVEGTNTIAVSAEDSVGNKRSLNFFVIMDTTGPEITFDQYLTPDKDGIQAIGGQVDVGSKVDVFVGDAAGVPAVVDGSLWHYDLDLSGLAEGVYDVSVIGYDELGNPSTEVGVQVEVDSLAPLLTVDQTSLARTADTVMTITGSMASGLDLVLTPVDTTASIENQTVSATADPDKDAWSADFVNLESGVNLLSVMVASAEAQVLAFRDLAAPSVVGNSPAYGATTSGVPNEVTVTFSEDMDAASVDVTGVATAESPSMTVVNSAATLVDGDIAYDPSTRKATYSPDVSLTTQETYTVTVKSTVTDALGNPLGSDYVWTFETN